MSSDWSTWAAAAFWIGVGGTLYAYAIFPVMAAILVRLRRPRWSEGTALERFTPVVTVIVPAYNEEASIEHKLRNLLASDYPLRLLDIIVVSDASSDGTDEVVRRFSKARVRLIRQERRAGKTSGLNLAVDEAHGDVIVFTDANALYPATAISALVSYFRHPHVGLVSGYTRYEATLSGEISEATNLYTSLERAVKKAEGAWGCCVGADGAIFAIRRALYRTLRADDINDLVTPLGVIDQGSMCVFADDVYCIEKTGKDLDSEFRRQSRITNRTLRALARNLHLLNPLRFPAFSFFLFSHKVMRFLVPGFLIGAGVALATLAPSGGLYLTAGAACLLILGIAAAASRKFVAVFFTVNLAVLHGWWKFLLGRTDVVWQHDRSAA